MSAIDGRLRAIERQLVRAILNHGMRNSHMQFNLRHRWVPGARVTNIASVPPSQRQIYRRDGAGYALTPGGHVLAQLRTGRSTAIDALTVLPRSRAGTPTISRRDWTQTVTTATDSERRQLLAAAARGELRINR